MLGEHPHRTSAQAPVLLLAATLLTVGLAGPLAAGASSDDTYYVSPEGDDANTCTSPDDACRTIQSAIDRSAAGDVILVFEGTYAEAVTVDVPVTVRAVQPDSSDTVVDATGIGTAVTVSADDARVEGFDLRGPDPLVAVDGAAGVELSNLDVEMDVVEEGSHTAVLLEGASDARIEDGEIRLSVNVPGFGGTARAVHALASPGLTVHDVTVTGDTHPGTAGVEIAPSSTADAGAGHVVTRNTLVGLERAVDVQGAADVRVASNLIPRTGIGIQLTDVAGASVADNVLVTTATDPFALDSVGVSLEDSSDVALAENLLRGLAVGIAVDGTTGVTSELDRIESVPVGIRVSDLTGTNGVDLEISNATLVTAGTALSLRDTTSDLTVDAECNDWGVYHADLIPTRIRDEGEDNTVDAEPFTSAEADGMGCLRPPSANFTADPDPGTRLDTVYFTDQSDEGSRSIVGWSWEFGDGAASSQENPSHSYDEVGDHFATLEVTDADGMTSKAVQRIDVENIPPELDPIGSHSALHSEEITFTANASDAEDDPLTFDAGNLPEGASLSDHGDGTATFAWDPAPDQYGFHDVNVSVTDGYDTVWEIARIEVVNNAPTFDPALPQSVATNETRTVELDVHAEDPDGDPITDLSADLSGLPDNATFTSSGPDGTLSWTPGLGEAGSYQVTFTADSAGRSTSDTVDVLVGEENVPPAIDAPDRIETPAGESISLTASATDPDGPDPLSWSVASDPTIDSSLTTSGTDASLDWTVPDDHGEDVTVTWSVTDGLGAIDATTLIHIQEPPRVDPGIPIETDTGIATFQPIAGQEMTVSLEASDVDGAVTDVTVRPDGASSDAVPMAQVETGLYETQLSYNGTGSHALVYEVTDDDGLTTTRTQHIHFTENTAPEVDASSGVIAGEATSPKGMQVSLRGTASDPENRMLEDGDFEWHLPTGQTETGSHVETWIPVGVHEVTLEVADPYGASGQDTVQVRVDDNLDADVTLFQADQKRGSTYVVEASQHVGDRYDGRVQVHNDLGLPVADANVTGTVTYHGLQAKPFGIVVASFEGATDGTGTLKFQFDQELAGASGQGPSLLSAPGYHELDVRVDHPSRPAAAEPGLEEATTTLPYMVTVTTS